MIRGRTSLMAFFVAASLVASAMQTHAQTVQVEPWKWRNPLPQGNDLRGVRVLPDRTILAVGSGGMLLRSTDDGVSWGTEPYPAGLRSLYAVDFPSPTLGFITGDDHEGVGKVARTTDGGATWTILPTASFAALYGIHFLDSNRGAVVGTGGTINSTTNGGSSWTQGSVGVFTDLYAVDIEFSARIMAGGVGGKVYYTPNSGTDWSTQNTGMSGAVRALRTRTSSAIALGDQGLIAFKSTDAAAWTPIESPLGNASYRSVHWIRDAVAVAVGTDGTAIRSDVGGLQWYDVSPGGSSTYNAVHAVDSTLIVAVGDAGAIMKSTGGGMSWTELTSGPPTTLNGIAVSPSRRRLAVGNAGTIFIEPDQDTDWSQADSVTTSALVGCAWVDDSVAIAVGNARILRTTDGGAVWDTISMPVTSNLRRVVSKNGVMLAAGSSGVILRSTDNGLSWVSMMSGSTAPLRSLAFASDTTVICVGSQGALLRSTDAGLTWEQVTYSFSVGLMNDVAFADSVNGFIVGWARDLGLAATLMQTMDGGATWISRSIPVPLDIPQPAHLQFNSVAFRAPGDWMIGGSHGMFYRSTNGGSTWTRLLTGTSGTSNGLAWAGDRWIAVGSGGMVLESPFDPSLAVRGDEPIVPNSSIVLNAYPNPFNPATTIVVESDRASRVTVEVYDLLGRRVASLFEGTLRQDIPQSLRFDASGFPSGTYFVAVVSGDSRSILPLLLLR